jgi:hypothetical protein
VAPEETRRGLLRQLGIGPAPDDVVVKAADNCAAGLRPSLCVNEDALKARACLDACISAIDVRQQTAASAAESSCESRLSERKGPLTCGLVTLPPAIKKAFETHPLDPLEQATFFGRGLIVDDFDTLMKGGESVLGNFLEKLGGTGAAQKFQQALNDAKGPWDDATLDAAFARWIPSTLQLREAACTATCNAHGRVAKEGPGLVHAYKLCMVAADSSLEARRAQAYESTLYKEFLEKADSKCRAGSRCDWLEGFSTFRCTYDTP